MTNTDNRSYTYIFIKFLRYNTFPQDFNFTKILSLLINIILIIICYKKSVNYTDVFKMLPISQFPMLW